MISPKDFEKARRFRAKDLGHLPHLVKMLRKESPNEPFIIEVSGQCRGNIKLPYDNFYIKGDAKITGSLYARMSDHKGGDLTTWRTATCKITGSHNIFEGITFVNDARSKGGQGQVVACGVYGDDNLFIGCNFISTQDTLFAGPLSKDLQKRYDHLIPEDERRQTGLYRNYFLDCYIEGDVDYIFGAGGAIFHRCTLVSNGPGWIAAPSHELEEDFGYLFSECDCKVVEGLNDEKLFLARPWRDYGKAVFYNCHYDERLNPLGFDDWVDRHHKLSNPNNTDRTKTARFYDYPLRPGRAEWTSNKPHEEIDPKYPEAVAALLSSAKDS